MIGHNVSFEKADGTKGNGKVTGANFDAPYYQYDVEHKGKTTTVRGDEVVDYLPEGEPESKRQKTGHASNFPKEKHAADAKTKAPRKRAAKAVE